MKNIIRKGMMLGILILFLGASVVSGVNTDAEKVKDIYIIENINDEILTFNPTDDTRVSHAYPERNYGSDSLTVVMNDIQCLRFRLGI